MTVSKNNSASEKANVIKSIFKKMKAKANIKKHKQEKALAAKMITTPKFSVNNLSKEFTESIIDASSKKFSQVSLQQWLPNPAPKHNILID